MKVRLIATREDDVIHLIRVDALLAGEHDLHLRVRADVEDAYHPDWLVEGPDGLTFTPPAFYLDNGAVKFLNGRHRFAVLQRHLAEVPMLLAQTDDPVTTNATCAVRLRTLSAGTLPEGADFTLPTLRIAAAGEFPPG